MSVVMEQQNSVELENLVHYASQISFGTWISRFQEAENHAIEGSRCLPYTVGYSLLISLQFGFH